jgi:outer membrane protein assembly factor BamE (lipoprotein component of BamABCDE complex)
MPSFSSLFAESEYDEFNLKELTAEEVKSIKQGILTVGMSKEAVLISYGTPPEHQTKNLSNERWYYWMDKHDKKLICFDENDRAVRCEDLNPKEL